MNNLELIVKMKFGSHLYGTTDEHSDLDYKGVFLVPKNEVLLGRIPPSHSFDTKKSSEAKNTKDDIDIEIYSLHYFIKLASEGQTVALDMLHAPDNMIEYKTKRWDYIVSHRSKFYTKNLKAFVGYARKQAAKYGIKGSRLNAARQVVNILKRIPDSDWKLDTVWGMLPVGEHQSFINNSPNKIKQYQVCGKILQSTQKISYTIDILNKFIDQYGKRALLAETNVGIDWKAISHALRAAYQVKELLTENTITFPLKNADYLLKVKKGELHYQNEVAPKLEKLMEEVEELSDKSNLPAKPDIKFWENFIVRIYNDIQ
jgi:predicted nucleotidyltransferase